MLARAFLTRFAAQHKRPVKTFSPRALAIIEQHKWPGTCVSWRLSQACGGHGRRTGDYPEDLELEELEVEEVPFSLREVRELAEW